MKTKVSRVLLSLLSLFLIVLVGCSNDSGETSDGEASETEESTADSSDNATYPIVIEHALGETVIESKPERVATIQWGNHDVVLALGVEPVGFSAANWGVEDGSGLLPWTSERLEELGITDPNIYQDTDGLDFEAISDSNPDVILASYSGITEEDYEVLTQIAPVVAYPVSPWTTSWREQIQYNSKGMGMEDEGDKLIAETEQLIANAAAQHPELEGKTIAWVNFSADDPSNLHLYTPVDPRVLFLEELGLSYPESIIELIEDETAYSLSLSAENADILNEVDVIIGYGDEDLYEAVRSDSRLGQIAAIERGSAVFISNSSDLAAAGTPNPLAIAYTVEDYAELLAEAVNKIDE